MSILHQNYEKEIKIMHNNKTNLFVIIIINKKELSLAFGYCNLAFLTVALKKICWTLTVCR